VINGVTAYQITSMLEGVVKRGTAAGHVNLPVPTAGKTGTTNDSRDVWFVGYTSNIAAGCYIGFDRPRTLGPRAFGGTLCAPVFQEFMAKATGIYGGGPFEVPQGGHFIKIDRYTGERLPDDAGGADVVAEFFRDGEEPVFGLAFDGGFAMGSNLPLFQRDDGTAVVGENTETVTTEDGKTVLVPAEKNLGTISSGGLY
jgi:penicillin-binding protein 1A